MRYRYDFHLFPVGVLFLTFISASSGYAWTQEELLERIDSQRMKADFNVLVGVTPVSGDPIISRNVHHPDHQRVQTWLEAQLTDIGSVEVYREDFSALGEDSLANIVGELPGSDPTLPSIVVGAHYDSIATLDPSQNWDPTVDPAPGADDDASGVVAVLELARVLGAWEGGHERTIRFVLFDAEEYGLIGSFEHTSLLADEGGEVELAYSLDPIGYNPGGAYVLWSTYDARWPIHSATLVDIAEGIASPLSVQSVDQETIGGDMRSDHYPFWFREMPAIHLGSFPQPSTYHTMNDSLDNVDLDYHQAVVSLVGAQVNELALPLEVLAGCGCRHSSLHGYGPTKLLILLGLLIVRRRSSCDERT